MAEVVRLSPSGPPIDAAGASKIQIARVEKAIPEGLASLTLATSGVSGNDLTNPNALTEANIPGLGVDLNAEFPDAQVGDVIEVTGDWAVRTASTSAAVLLFEVSTDGGQNFTRVGSNWAKRGGANVNADELTKPIAENFTLTEGGTVLVQAFAVAIGSNVEAQTDQNDTTLKQGCRLVFTRLTNINNLAG